LKKRATNIKQHFIPQFYLRNFTNKKGRLHVYDVLRNNHYVTNPAKECYEEFFYDIETEIFKLFCESEYIYEELVDDKIRLLNENVSSILFNLLNTIKESTVNFQFERDDRNKLYNFIVLQIIRTPCYRSRLKYLNLPFCIKTGLSGELGDKKTQDLVHNLLILGVLNHLDDTKYQMSELYYTIFDHLIKEILDIKRQLNKSGKLFLVNRTTSEFICSSSAVNVLWKYNPVAFHKALVTSFDDSKLFDLGDYLEFQTIHLPISSDVAIFLFDKNCNPNLTTMNQSIGIIQDWNSDLLLNLNYSTMLKNGNKIYSASGNYSEMIRMFSERINPMMNFRFGDKQ
jgi:hypothetical protein